MCDHPNVVKLIDTFENSEYFFIVLEYLNGGDLFEYLNKKEFKITEDRARQITHQILNALYYLKSMGVAHRDIKLENIIMSKDTDDSDIKLIDLGLSKVLGPSETSTDPYGTLAYVAPEVLLQRPYQFEVDLWSTGVIVYVMLSGLLPFDAPTNRETARQTISSPVPFTHKLWEFVSYDAKDLILKLLEKDQKQRITVQEALMHPWVCRRSRQILKIREGAA
jgi:serine/threonine protein kinase